MRREAARTRPTAFFAWRVVTAHQKKLVDDDIDKEADRGGDQDRLRRIFGPTQMQRFGKQIEEGERDHRPRAEGEYQMQPILEAQRRQSTQKRGAESPEGDRKNKESVDGRLRRESRDHG